METQNEELRRAQTVIEDVKRRFSDLYDFAPVGYFTIDKKGSIVEANLTAARLLGFDKRDMIGKPLYAYIHPEDKDILYLHLKDLRKNESRTCEIRLAKKCATFFQVQLVSTPLAGDIGAAEEFLIAVMDISARKSSEEKLAQHYAILEAVMESSDGPIFSIDRDYRYLCFNSHHAKVMKALFNADIKVGGSLLDYHSNNEDRRTAKMNIDKAFRGEMVTVETYAGEKDRMQGYFKISHNPVRGLKGEVLGVSVFSLDLTERKAMEEQLRIQKVIFENTSEFLTKVLDGISDGFFSYDEELKVTYFNPAAERLLGKKKEEVLGRHLFDEAFPEAKNSIFEERYTRALRSRKPDSFETHFEVKPYSNWYEVRLHPYEKGICVFFQVITERKQWESSILDLNERLLVSNHELETLGHTLSHDLRGPLRVIDGFSGILLESQAEKLDKESKEFLKIIGETSQRMGGMISGLLEISRITRAEIRREKIDISALVHTIAQAYRMAEPARDIELSIQDDLFAECDAKLVHIALDNLIRNAWKFTRNRPKSVIEFGITKNRGAEAFFLRDNGAGFDMRNADKMFTVFQRLHSDSEFEGTGIGLATVRRIIRRHGGEIRAEGEVDKGATFYFTLS